MFKDLINKLVAIFGEEKAPELPNLTASDWFERPFDEVESLYKRLRLTGELNDLSAMKGELPQSQVELMIAHLHIVELRELDRSPYVEEKLNEMTISNSKHKSTREWLDEGEKGIHNAMTAQGITWSNEKEIQLHLVTSSELKQLVLAHNILVRVEEDLRDMYLKKIDLTRAELALGEPESEE